ncbi:BTAD domain-containing putative transcriptional regulator [Nocardioides sp. URHA0032]|uniref:BTAD domain-containing putative transcriptional regulator n=1 Tax=Nocardioides sp. URHA0032 TaxID=1380388 RepID=UPI00048AF420|nr:BTAD domain-containing putative transcriptional regulator [Nocardioides sp. URHA0032]
MEVSVLGPIEVSLAGAPVDLGTPKQRALVAALALSRGWPVSVDAIVDLLWDDSPPPGVTATLQAYVSQLRRVLEPDRQRRAPATVLVTVAPGYALRVPDESVDAHRFEQAVTTAHRTLQPLGWGRSPLDEGRLTAVVAALDEALASWRGTPYGELGDADSAVAERARLEELRLIGLEDRAVGGLALGRHATVAAELEALTAAHPLRERMWALRALALTRSGRQADALDVLRRVREVLDEELGLELSAELRDLQTAVLRQDPGLDWVAPDAGSTPAVAVPPAPAPAVHPAAEQVAPWPMVGRDAELASLLELVGAAERGAPAYAVITGDPGIGKSRLAAELVVRARHRGLRVLVGRCSQDDGAPPLWPWKTVLDGLGASLLDEAPADEGEGGQFRAWERIADTIRAAAQEQPTVVVLDDLHWADTSSLRVLRLLVETTDQARLMLVTTWRAHPEPSGALADVAETLARMHALRLQLSGLPPTDAASVFESVTSRGLDAAEAAALRDRTDGNPFFLVELARLAGERGAPGDELPTAVADVINRRLLRLPEQTVAALRAAAVIGRQFDTPTLATVTGIDEDDLLDVVEPAQAAGLVREDGIDRYLFAHALVRDTLRSGMSASRRARAHARVADALTGVPGRETEVARHWHEAGPSYGDRAWRSAVEAAAVARRFYAYDQAAELLEGALVSLDTDGQATLRDRYDVLMALIEAYRWAAQLPDLVATVEQAIEVGKQLRDPEAVARAAIATTEGVLWRSGPPGDVNEEVVGALRGSLDRLPADDSDLRCRTMLALANELYDTVSWEERRALCDEGLAMARRLDDPLLLMFACQVVFVALWTADTAVERVALVREARDLARSTRNERAYVVCATLHAAVLSEVGRTEEMWRAIEEARSAAQQQRIAFGELVLGGLEIPWHAMAGRFEECERLLGELQELGSRLSHHNVDESMAAALLAIRLWQGRPSEMVPVLDGFDATPYPFGASVAVYLWRAGEHDNARQVYAERGAPLDHDNDISLLAWAHAAELSLYLGEPALAAGAYAKLAPLAGLNTCAGSSLALGPVDSYLALAAAATGERELAAKHAEDALALADAWDVPLVAAWLRGLREEHGF